MTLTEAVLILCIAYRLHGTDAAVVHACRHVRDKVDRRWRPLINRGMRCSSPAQWAINIEKEMGW